MSATLAAKVEALRRLCPVKARILELIAEAMLREAQSKNPPQGKAAKKR